jgi:Mn-containing catalase
MSREITHMKAFTAALESMGKPVFSIGRIPPTPRLVNQYFNDSTGMGDRGEPDARGPWNEGGDWEFVTAPAFQQLESLKAGTRSPSEKSVNGGSGNGHAKGSNRERTSKAGTVTKGKKTRR